MTEPTAQELKKAFEYLRKNLTRSEKSKPDLFFIFDDNPLFHEALKNHPEACEKYCGGIIFDAKKIKNE